MDDAREEIGRRIVEAARLAVWLHLQAEQDAEANGEPGLPVEALMSKGGRE